MSRLAGDPAKVQRWLQPVQDALDEALAGLPEQDGPGAQEQLQARMKGLLAKIDGLLGDMDTSAIEDVLARAMFAGDTNGRIQSAAGASHQ